MVSVRGSVSRLARPLMGISDRPSGPCKFRTGKRQRRGWYRACGAPFSAENIKVVNNKGTGIWAGGALSIRGVATPTKVMEFMQLGLWRPFITDRLSTTKDTVSFLAPTLPLILSKSKFQGISLEASILRQAPKTAGNWPS